MVKPPPTSNKVNLIEVKREVQLITGGTSEKYVPDPEKNKVLSDVLIGIKRFRYNVRWKYYFNERDRLKDLNLKKDNNNKDDNHLLNSKKKKKKKEKG